MRVPRLPESPAAMFAADATTQLRRLIEQCRLYQHVDVAPSDAIIALWKTGDENRDVGVLAAFAATTQGEWRLVIGNRLLVAAATEPPSQTRQFLVELPTAKLYCTACDRVEAFNPVGVGRASNIEGAPASTRPAADDWWLCYRCQSCKGAPETLLVRREGCRLTMCGRAPILAVQVDSVFPKTHRKYIRKAIIAAQCGETLAGLFYLRVFVEQFCAAKNVGNPGGRADEHIDAYMDSLDPDFTSRFPSIREAYASLSQAIHAASEDAELFFRLLDDLQVHFQGAHAFEAALNKKRPP
jgi:hypothetical protein